MAETNQTPAPAELTTTPIDPTPAADSKTIADVPDWGKGTVQKRIDSGVIHGDENGDINVSGDMLRGMVIMGRMLEKK